MKIKVNLRGQLYSYEIDSDDVAVGDVVIIPAGSWRGAKPSVARVAELGSDRPGPLARAWWPGDRAGDAARLAELDRAVPAGDAAALESRVKELEAAVRKLERAVKESEAVVRKLVRVANGEGK